MDTTKSIEEFVNKRGYELTKDELNRYLTKCCAEKIISLDNSKYLIEKGAKLDVNQYRSKNLFCYDNSPNNFSVTKYLVEKGKLILTQEELDNLLIYKSMYGFLEDVKYLIEKGANIKVNDSFLLTYPISNNHLEVVKYLVEKGANLDKVKNEVLYSSANEGHFEMVRYLLENGANINLLNDYLKKYEIHFQMFQYIKDKMIYQN